MNIGFFDGVAFFFDHDEKSGLYKQGEIIDGDDTFLSEDLEDATEFICTTEHAIACVNALQGIPTELLGEVKKAWVCSQVMGRFAGVDDNGAFIRVGYYSERPDGFHLDDVLPCIFRMRSRGADFGELNALLDSVKEQA